MDSKEIYKLIDKSLRFTDKDNYIYNADMIFLRPSILDTLNIQLNETTTKLNDTYTVGTNYDIYRRNENIQWDIWSQSNGSGSWTLLGTITNVGSSYALDIPANATEINIEVFPDSYDGFSIQILTANLTTSNKGYDGGFYKTSQDNMRVLVYATTTKIWLQEVVKNTQSKSTVDSCTVYYK